VRDEELMTRASDLARAVRRRTAPNPWVGALVVRDGIVVGEGATERPGGPHAEMVALRTAAERARGATLYVTLEPCSHQGRTPPCADAVIEAGIEAVVVALPDPDPRVAGRGLDRLRDAGLDVRLGIGAVEVERELAPYLHHRRHGRAFCLAKVAMSMDGGTAAANGSSRWITAAPARADAHELRADSQALVIGSGTALADDPRLDVRDVADPPVTPPLRVLLDGRGRVPARGPLFDEVLGPLLVVTTERAARDTVDGWHSAGAKVEIVAAAPGGGVDLRATLELLGRLQVLQAMFEGGATVLGSLVAGGLVDRLVAYIAPIVLGDRSRAAFAWDGPEDVTGASRFEVVGVRCVGDDVRVDLVPRAGIGRDD
jgi:diaminohydroxyphosphoribosylaminopyrimidine deaminase / 5-amino-6-(5-phosphoribosylamino)uracil reductase